MTSLLSTAHVVLTLLLVLGCAAFIRGWRCHPAASALGLVGCVLFGLHNTIVTVVLWFSWSNGKPDNALADWLFLTLAPLEAHWAPFAITVFMLAVVLDRGPLLAFLTSSGWTISRRPLVWATLALLTYLVGVGLNSLVAPYRRGFLGHLPAPAAFASTLGWVLRNWLATVLVAYAAVAGRSAIRSLPAPPVDNL